MDNYEWIYEATEMEGSSIDGEERRGQGIEGMDKWLQLKAV